MKSMIYKFQKKIETMSKNLILLLLIIFTLTCCDKDDDKTAIEQLPPATTIGANKAGCLVNGQVFLPKGSSQFGTILSCFYQQDQGGYHFGLSIVEKSSNQNKIVILSLNPNAIVENTTYYLVAKVFDSNNDNQSNFGEFWITSNTNSAVLFRTKNSLPGELKITKFDTQQKIISGTFWYDSFDVNGEKVEVREGRFDMRYIN